MLTGNSSHASETLRFLPRETVIEGRTGRIPCAEIGSQTYSIRRIGPARVVQLEHEWYEDVGEPRVVIDTLRRAKGGKADIFSFWQRLPDVEPKYSYSMEWEELAVLPIKDYQHWWNHQIKSRVRNL